MCFVLPAQCAKIKPHEPFVWKSFKESLNSQICKQVQN